MTTMMRKIKNKPPCFGNMYELGEEYMCSNCLGCEFFNECKDEGYGNDEIPASILIPAETSTDHEYIGRW